jgi:hypothetical protein
MVQPIQPRSPRDLSRQVHDLDRLFVRLAALLLRVPSVRYGSLVPPLVNERQDPRSGHLSCLSVGSVLHQSAERSENCSAGYWCIAVTETELESVPHLSFASGQVPLHLLKLFFNRRHEPS